MNASRPAQISSGRWQRIVGAFLLFFGFWGMLAHDYATGGLLVATAGSFIYWGIMLGHFHLLEAKIDRLLILAEESSPHSSTAGGLKRSTGEGDS